MTVGVSGREERPPMIWVGGAHGVGKTSWSWQLSRAHDLPLHSVDLWSYDHQARLPAGDSLDEQVARVPDAAASAPGLAPGRELSRQRRYENRAAGRQGRLWVADAGLTVAPSYPFGCECGTSGCRATWTATADDYTARTDGERPLIVHRPRGQ
jgi:hypothetical protein